MAELMSNISIVMALYIEKLISEEKVIAWADKQILANAEPFEPLCQLSVEGPKSCLRLPESEFPRYNEFTFMEKFALRTHDLDIENGDELTDFLVWLASASLGYDIQDTEVHLGYLIDHYWFECGDKEYALSFARQELPPLIVKHKSVAKGIWKQAV